LGWNPKHLALTKAIEIGDITVTTTRVRISAAVLAVLAAFFVAFQATNAAFSAQTSNPDNAFAAGTVILTDNDSDFAMFDLPDMAPGDSAIGCIEVTYSGTLDPEVRLFGAATAGDGLEDFLDLTVERGDGDCTTFGTTTAVWTNGTDGDLGVFLGSATDYTSGVDTWQPTGGAPDDTVPYRFTVGLQDNDAAQGLTVTVTFTWEAQNL
jgi:hypothetical protein